MDSAPLTLTIQGRRFSKAVTTTFDQDAYVTKRMRSFGLSKMVEEFDPDKEGMSEFAENVLMEAFEKGVMYEILAGLLVEDNVPWTRDVAAVNAILFAGLTRREDKAAIYESLASVLFDFLVSAAAWSMNSRKSFTEKANGAADPITSQNSEARNDSTLENGTVLSVN